MTKYHLAGFLITILIIAISISAENRKRVTPSKETPVNEKIDEIDIEALIEVIAEFMREHEEDVDDRLFKMERVINQTLLNQIHFERGVKGFHADFKPNNKKLWSCAHIFANDNTLHSGIYNITVPNLEKPFEVYCLADPQGGCAWTVVWRRQDIGSDFHRKWKDYKIGFGLPEHNFFIGLERLYAITFAETQEIRIGTKYELDEWDTETYDKFAIGDESTQYEVIVLGAYKNNTNYQRLRKNTKFFTKNLSTLQENKECAKALKMGWWFSDDCKERFKIRGFYSYLNSPTYVAVRPQHCVVELNEEI